MASTTPRGSILDMVPRLAANDTLRSFVDVWRPWLDDDVARRLLHRGLVLAAVTWGFGMTAALVARAGVDFEAQAVRFLADHRHEGVASALLFVGRSASFTFVLGVGLVAVVWAWRRTGHWEHAKVLAAGMGGALGVVGAVKFTTLRGRPEEAAFDTLSTAFPSGHVARAVVVFGLAAWLAQRRLPRGSAVAVAVLAVVLMGLVGLSRVYLGVHWPSDVIAGYVIGLGWLALVIAVARDRVDFSARRRPG